MFVATSEEHSFPVIFSYRHPFCSVVLRSATNQLTQTICHTGIRSCKYDCTYTLRAIYLILTQMNHLYDKRIHVTMLRQHMQDINIINQWQHDSGGKGDRRDRSGSRGKNNFIVRNPCHRPFKQGDVIPWNLFPHYWLFVWGFHQSRKSMYVVNEFSTQRASDAELQWWLYC